MSARRLALGATAATAALLAACTSNPAGGPSSRTASRPTAVSLPGNTSDPATASVAPTPTATAGPSRPVGAADWPMYHGTPDRRGTAIGMPAVHGAPSVLQKSALDQAMYASPVVAGGTVIAATEGNTVYALTATGRVLWKEQLGPPSPAAERPCGNVDPLGITGTPIVADGTVYVAPELSGTRHRLVALDLATGAVRWQRSLDLPGVEAAAMQERGALAIAGGRVWVPFGGLAGDCGGYKGRVVGIRLDGTGEPVTYTVPTSREAGIWTPPGPSVDAAGHLFVAVGNGAAGVGDPYDHSDSVLELGTDGALLDSFSPSTWATDNNADLDLGSQGPALVGPWVFAAGKSGTAYVLRRTHLGGIGGEVSRAEICTSFGGTAVAGDVVYVPCTDGLRAVRIDATGTMHVLWHAESSISGSPVVGGGRVWSLDTDAGVLHALDPRTGAAREQVSVGATSRFATPALSGRDVLVPTLAGLTVVRTS